MRRHFLRCGLCNKPQRINFAFELNSAHHFAAFQPYRSSLCPPSFSAFTVHWLQRAGVLVCFSAFPFLKSVRYALPHLHSQIIGSPNHPLTFIHKSCVFNQLIHYHRFVNTFICSIKRHKQSKWFVKLTPRASTSWGKQEWGGRANVCNFLAYISTCAPKLLYPAAQKMYTNLY